jgi:hypothetical protein
MLTHGCEIFFSSADILSAVILIRALLLVPIKVECTLLQDNCKFKFYIINFNKETKPAHVTYNANLRRNTLAV